MEARSTTSRRVVRDARVDFLRGVSLIMIYFHHCTGTVFWYICLSYLQFTESSQMFFCLSGFSCMAVYGKKIRLSGVRASLSTIAKKCVEIYAAQILTIVVALLIFYLVSERIRFFVPAPLPTHPTECGVACSDLFLTGRFDWTFLTLQDAPSFFEVIRTYVILIGAFPLIALGVIHRPILTVAISLALWVVSHGAHGLHFDNAATGQPWRFNPFAWQAVFVGGALLHRLLERGPYLPRNRWAVAAAVAIVAWGFAFRVGENFGLQIPHPATNKPNISPIILANTIAVIYLFFLLPAVSTLSASRWVGFIRVCGKHSLWLYCFGTILALLTDIAFMVAGKGIPVQLAATALCVAAMAGLARVLEARKNRSRERTLAMRAAEAK